MLAPTDIVFPATAREEAELRIDSVLRRPWSRREARRRVFLPSEFVPAAAQIILAYADIGWNVDGQASDEGLTLTFDRPGRAK